MSNNALSQPSSLRPVRIETIRTRLIEILYAHDGELMLGKLVEKSEYPWPDVQRVLETHKDYFVSSPTRFDDPKVRLAWVPPASARSAKRRQKKNSTN